MKEITIGVVEDEMIIAKSIVSTLLALQYKVIEPASNYKEAIEMIDATQPDVLLLDINLGGQKDGIDVAMYARENYSLPIIFLTANSDKETIQRAKIAKPNAYLVKPFNKEDLYASIEIAINNFENNKQPKTDKSPTILFKNGHDFVSVDWSKITFIESETNYLKIHIENERTVMIRSTLTEVQKLLPSQHFTHIRRGVIVNHRFVKKIAFDSIELLSMTFKITSTAKKELLAKLNT
ncbi:MAG: response regulator [Chitinophagaceae bacterium]